MTTISAILRDGSNVDMPALRAYLAALEASLAQANLVLASGTVSALVEDRAYATQAALFADLVPADDLFALVYADADPLKNGLYQKDGATTAGDWDGPLDLFSSAAAALVQPFVDAAEAAQEAAEEAAAPLVAILGDEFYQALLGLADEYGLTPFVVGQDGVTRIAEAVINVIRTSGGRLLHAEDDYDLRMFSIEDGELKIDRVTAREVSASSITGRGATPPATGTWIAEDMLFMGSGQSESLGQAAFPVISTTQPYESQMLSVGVRVSGVSDFSAATYAPLVEADADPLGETPVAASLQFINELIEAENGIASSEHSLRMVGMTGGQGGTAIAGLASGTTPFTTLVAAAARSAAISNTAQRSWACPAIHWSQGVADTIAGTTLATYRSALIQLREDYDAEMKTIKASNPDLQMFLYTDARAAILGDFSHTIARAQIEASDLDDNIHIACPGYMFEYADNVHLSSASSKWLGAYYGLAFKRVVIDGLDWKPLRALSVTIDGYAAYIKFDVPVGRLRWNAQREDRGEDRGFRLRSTGGTGLSLSSTEIIAADTVKLVSVDPIPAGAKVLYPSVDGVDFAGRWSGDRGSLTDCAGDYLPRFDPLGLNISMDNWALPFVL